MTYEKWQELKEVHEKVNIAYSFGMKNVPTEIQWGVTENGFINSDTKLILGLTEEILTMVNAYSDRKRMTMQFNSYTEMLYRVHIALATELGDADRASSIPLSPLFALKFSNGGEGYNQVKEFIDANK